LRAVSWPGFFAEQKNAPKFRIEDFNSFNTELPGIAG
jgi:hypothetical protein